MYSSVKFLDKDRLESFLGAVAADYTLFVPEKNNDSVTFSEFRKNRFMLFPYTNFDIPPSKIFLFPSTIRKYIDRPFDEKWLIEGKKAVFGARPCDAYSNVLLERAMKDNDSFRERREQMLFIVLGCNFPRKTCFCTSVNCGPFSTSGADVFITDIGDGFVLEDISGKASGYLAHLTDAGKEELVKKEKISSQAAGTIGTDLELDELPDKLEGLNKKFTAEGVWAKLGHHCTNCMQCTSVCPTCHCCFVVEDIVEMVCDEMGEKAKDFDPCMLNIAVSDGLTGEVPLGHQRLQRRLMDKFCRTMKTFGQPFCVGCGRCVEHCTENIDITEILKFIIAAENRFGRGEDLSL